MKLQVSHEVRFPANVLCDIGQVCHVFDRISSEVVWCKAGRTLRLDNRLPDRVVLGGGGRIEGVTVPVSLQ